MKTFCKFVLLTSALGVPTQCYAADGRIAIRIVDSAGETTPARAWVDADGQRLFKPITPDTATPYNQDRSFSCDGLRVIKCRSSITIGSVNVSSGHFAFQISPRPRSQ